MRLHTVDGFALPLTIFVLAVITIMLATILVRVQVDRRLAETTGDIVGVGGVAEAGLNRYYAHRDSLGARPPDGDSVRFNVIGGYADVTAHVTHMPADTLVGITYIVRSLGTLIKPTQGADPQARRAVAQFARWQSGMFGVIGALTTINDFQEPCGSPGCDGTVLIGGDDDCVPAYPSVPGLRMPSDASPSTLAPPDVTPYVSEVGTATAVSTETGIDWAAVVAGGWDPDFTSLTSPLSWSSYLLSGNVALTDISGTGLLVVTGDLTVDGSQFDWLGVVLVGGRIIFEADTSRVVGVVVSGLQTQIAPPAPATGTWGLNGTHIEIRYASCNVRTAFQAFTGFVPIQNGWMDNGAEY